MKPLRWLWFSLLVTASVGVLWTAAFASTEVRDQAYLAMGLPNNALHTLVKATLDGALLGALVGAGVFSGAAAVRAVGRALHLGPKQAWMPYFLCTLVSLLVIGARTMAYGPIGAWRLWGIISMTALWCGLFISRRWTWVTQQPVLSMAVTANLYVVSVLTPILAVVGRTDSLRLLRRPELILVAIATYLVCLLTVGRAATRAVEPIPRPMWLLTVPAFLPFVLPVVGPLLFQPSLNLKRPANVLLIGIDTLRADHTSLHDGSGRPTSPHLAALGARGTVFDNAISQAPWTMPSFGSIMTGRYPREHGAFSLIGSLRPTEITLAERLREAGFETAGIVSHLYVNSAHGFAQGFDMYDETNVRGHHAVTSSNVTELALNYLDQGHREPFFLFLHYFDPHLAYRDHAEFDYADAYRGWLRDSMPTISRLRDRQKELSEADVDYLRDLYDEEISFTDTQIGRVLSRLRDTGLDRKTIVVVVADHGEAFMEHGSLGHTTSLHEELIHVPLIIALPSDERQIASVATPVETRAIQATVIDFMEPEIDSGISRGSLLPLMRGAQERAASIAFSEVWLPDADIDRRAQMSSLRTDRWKFTRDLTRGEDHLYDLSSDPHERSDLLGVEHEQAARLRGLLETWLRVMDGLEGDAPTSDVTEEQIRQLRSLGYVN